MNTKLPRTARFGAAFSATLLLSGLSASGATILYEGFDIEPGEIDNTAGATSFGWAEGSFGVLPWTSWDQDADVLYHAVSETGLTWPDLPTVGGSFEFHNEPLQAILLTERKMSGFYSQSSSGQLWMSALLQASIEGDPAGGGFFQLVLTTETSTNINAVYLGIANNGENEHWSAGGERLYVLGSDGDKWGMSSERIVEGETAFLVMHFDFDANTAAFYANPDASATDPGEPAVEFEILDDFFVQSVKMWIQNAGVSVEGEGADYTGSLIDEIRLGDTYADVAADARTIDPVDPGPEEPPTWAGLDLAEGTGWVFTNDAYLGWLWVGEQADQDWVYSYSLGSYIYLPQENYQTSGSWVYAFDLDTWETQDDYAPTLEVEALQSWIYVFDYSETAVASRVYVWNSAAAE